LRRLTGEEYDALSPHLERVVFKRHDIAVHANVPFDHAYFPESGLASVISHTEDGRRLEVGLFGREAMVSSAIVLGADRIPLETFAQIPGVWIRVGADALRAAMRRHPGLHALLLRYVQTFLMTVSSTALSNGAYRVEERLARWLVMTHDRIDGDDLPLTHEFLSLMLGVRRSGVTVAIHTLEGARMIKAKRGSLTVLDRAGLEAAAGASYGTAEAEYERLIGPLSPKRPPVRERGGES